MAMASFRDLMEESILVSTQMAKKMDSGLFCEKTETNMLANGKMEK